MISAQTGAHSCSDSSSCVSVNITMATEPQSNLGKLWFGPSDELIAVFKQCRKDPTEVIKTRLKRLIRVFLRHVRDNTRHEKNNEVAAKCCCEAGVWYYRILEILVKQERKRPGVRDISGMLEKELFHCCLVVCCLEISITSKPLCCDFPLLLHVFNVAPYHFWKVIEPVLRAEVGLSHTVVQHLREVEEKILESLAWTRDSPLLQEIRANGSSLPTCRQVMPHKQFGDPSKTDSNPQREDLTDQQSSTSAVNNPQRSSSLHLFVRKVYSLMAMHLRKLCTELDVAEELRLKIWTCFEFSVVHHTELMVDRHLDQLLLCSIYIMARITMKEIPFKHIMRCYAAQPNASNGVCKNVLLSGGDMENCPTRNNNNGDHRDTIPTPNTPSTHYPGPCQKKRGNLICFYNQVYTIKMQHFAESQFSLKSGGDTPPLSPYPRQWNSSPRRRQLTGGRRVFISLLSPGPRPPRRPGLSYSFNSSPSERLCDINNMIKAGRPPARRRRRGSPDRDGGEDGPPARRPRLDGQSQRFRRRLENMVADFCR